MKAPKRSEDQEPPGCLTDDSNGQIPRDYIQNWKVTDGNKEQRLVEIVYTIKLLKSKALMELITDSKKYERDYYLLSKGMFKAHCNKNANRQLILETLLDNGLIDHMRDYWNSIVEQFELKRKEADESLITVGQVWKSFTESQPHLVSSLLNYYSMLTILWNGSDMKVGDILKRIYDGSIEFILQSLDVYLFPLDVDSHHPQHKVVTSCLGIVHNLCNKYDDCLTDLRQRDGFRIISQYRYCGTSSLKTKSILSCSYLLTEKDDSSKAVIELDESDITFVTKVLRDALLSTNEHSRKYGYHASELIAGFNNIAAVDSNKKRLVDAGVLPLYVDALGRKKPALQEAAAKGIWALAFDDESRRILKDDPECMNELRKLSDSSIPTLKSAASGALWKIEGETEHLQKLSVKQSSSGDTNTGKKLQHIMISYQWEVQSEVLKLRKRLKEAGYRVWIDVEQMSGSTLEAMAKAVENSAVVVLILTEKYKVSPACRQEAEYAHHLQKKMLPIRLQPKYRPDGWLGFLLGSTYFYDLTKKEEYENKFKDFIKAVGEDGRIQPGEDENPVIEANEVKDTDEPSNPENSAVVPTRPQQPVVVQGLDMLNSRMKPMFDVSFLICQNWTTGKVNEWLRKHRLEDYIQRLAGLDGRLLAELISMRFVSPDVYYDLMRKEHEMPMLHILRLNAAIRELANQ